MRAPRRLTWTIAALEELREFVAIMPAAALEAVDAMERMAATGFNYGRATAEAGGWYLPTSKLGIFYSDVDGELAVVRLLDARRLRELP